MAKRSSPPSDPKAPDAQVDDYDPADHVEDIPPKGETVATLPGDLGFDSHRRGSEIGHKPNRG